MSNPIFSQLTSRIQAALGAVGLTFYEHWVRVEDPLYMVELHDLVYPDDQPLLRVAGRGRDRSMALLDAHLRALAATQAAPYAAIGRRFGLMPEQLVPPDEVEVSLDELERDLVPFLRGPGDRKVRCVPFYDVTGEREVLLPPGEIHEACGRVGLCARPSPKTSLVAGICDVIRHHVAFKTLSDDDLELPEIPRPAVQHLAAFEPVAALGLGPLQVVVKDCTLGGQLPVVALLLLDKDTGEYLVCHGAAATLEGAIARCVERWNVKQGEVLAREQGEPDAAYLDRLGEDEWLSLRSGGSISDHLGLSIFRPRGEPRHASAFLEGPAKTEDELRFLVELLKRGGHRLLVRDLSFLGLPSFLVYVPGMSDVGVTDRDPLASGHERAMARKTLLSLGGSPPETFRDCARRLERLAEMTPSRRPDLARETMGIAVDPEAGFSQLLDTDYLLAELWRGAREPGRAAACLKRHLSSLSETEKDEVEHWGYYWSSWAYLELWSRGLPESEITATLTSLYGEGRAWELDEDIGQPENAFDYYATPVCGDCAGCPIEEHCLYPRWKAVADELKACMVRSLPRQGALSSLFSTG